MPVFPGEPEGFGKVWDKCDGAVGESEGGHRVFRGI